jgi:hypothetical protein
MLGNFGADGADGVGAAKAGNARSIALVLMSKALGHLDSDRDIPPIVGAHLQSAIDALWTSVSQDPHSINLH